MLMISPMTPEAFEAIKPWWTERGLTPPSEKFLPPFGLIVYEAESVKALCAGFLFTTDAHIGIINHVISNPARVNQKIRDMALERLIFKLCEAANRVGLKMVTAASNVARMNKRYEKLGFTKTDSNEVHYGRLL
jgi:hypothetical protein